MESEDLAEYTIERISAFLRRDPSAIDRLLAIMSLYGMWENPVLTEYAVGLIRKKENQDQR